MNQEKIGEFLKKLRKDNNLTQAEFADKLGVTYQAVSKWENGKNIPDIAILKEISKIFDVNIDEIISGEKSKEKNKKASLIITIGFIIVLAIMLGVIVFLLITKNEKTSINEIGAKCERFKVSGTLVYSNDKSYIHIPVITFCEKDEEIYSSIECTLYETYGDTTNKISSCDKGNNVTLKEYLENVKIHADNYKHVCSNVDSIEMYLDISAVKEGKTTTYKVPLELSKTCTK